MEGGELTSGDVLRDAEASLAQIKEPPKAAPHEEWCGRGGAVSLPYPGFLDSIVCGSL